MEELETSRFKSIIIINEKYNIVWRLIKLNVINLFLFSIRYKTRPNLNLSRILFTDSMKRHLENEGNLLKYRGKGFNQNNDMRA